MICNLKQYVKSGTEIYTVFFAVFGMIFYLADYTGNGRPDISWEKNVANRPQEFNSRCSWWGFFLYK